MRRRATLAAAIAGAAAAAACGSDGPVCGNGVVEPDNGEQCDDGNDDQSDFCRDCFAYLPPRTIVKWLFNAEAAEGFNQDSCTDLGAFQVTVTLTGGTEVTEMDMCSVRQVVFDDLPPGTYTAAVTPLTAGGEPLVAAPVEQEIVAQAVDTEHTIVVPPEAWSGTYTGTFFFTVHWGGLDCAAATPGGPVDQQRITLTVDGTVVAQSTTGTPPLPLDGSAPGPCVPAANPSPQSALAVPFGYATISIVGLSGGTETFRGTFDTFVGAGVSNPTLDFDVQTVYDAMPPDAMPDADIDAM